MSVSALQDTPQTFLIMESIFYGLNLLFYKWHFADINIGNINSTLQSSQEHIVLKPMDPRASFTHSAPVG